jgi:bifunctional DNase/RNase
MLRDANSGQRLALRTGPFEVWAMNVALGGREPPRPLTHRAMLNTIVALGAALNAVRIDRFIPDQHVFHAKLELRKMGENVLVDVRPSDAITIALAANVGILVAKEVVAELAKLGG